MKRAGFLIDDIAEMKNLTLAFYKAAKGKRMNNNATNCRVANRNNNSPSNRNNNNGFRLALAQKTVSEDPLVNRESSCVSFLETENEQCYIAQHPILVGIPEAFSNNSDVIFRNNLN